MVYSFNISVNRPAPTRILRVHLVRGGFITAEFPRSRKPPEGGEKLERLGVRVPRYPSAGGPAKPLPEEDELRRALATVDILAARLRAARPGD
jgi:hypothetical protein